MLNQRILNSVGRQNYGTYIIITNGKEIDSILDGRSTVFEMYKYRDKLIDENIGQDIQVHELEDLLQDNNDIELKQQLENLFLENISNSKFKIIKDMLINHELGWNISRLVEVHRKNKGYRIFKILSIEYNDWLD